MDSAQAAASSLTTYEWLSIIGFILLSEGVLVGLLYSNIIAYIKSVKTMVEEHVVKDDKHQARQNLFMGYVAGKLGFDLPEPEE